MNPLLARLLHMVSLGVVTVVDDSQERQLLQVTETARGPDSAAGVIDDVPRITEFGFTSNPPINSRVMVVRLFGNRSLTIAIGTSDAGSRLKGLSPGDTAIYDLRGAYVKLTPTGPVVDAAGLAVRVQNATTVTIVASEMIRCEAPLLECTGDIVSRADGTQVSLNGLHDAYNAHKHTGVQSGTSSSGPTDHSV